MSYNFFCNVDCEYYPCHSLNGRKAEEFNCLMCYCPLYVYNDCGGQYTTLDNGIKDCTNCTIPHYNYDYIVKQLIERNNK